MSIPWLLSFYLSFNVLVVLSSLGLALLRRAEKMTAESELRLNYILLASIPLVLVTSRLFGAPQVFQPYARIWSTESIRNFSAHYSSGRAGGVVHLPAWAPVPTFPLENLSVLFLIAAIWGIALVLRRFWRELGSVRQIFSESVHFKRLGSLQILVNDSLRVPISFYLPGKRAVVLPSEMLGRPEDFRMAMLHELQHHRQGDTFGVYGLWILRLLCGWNPAVAIWIKNISEVQEFASDEALVGHGKVSSHAYARCLVQVAESAVSQKGGLACATGLAFLTDQHSLIRRVRKMMFPNSRKIGTSFAVLVGLSAVGALWGVAFASQGWIQDRRVSLREAQKMLSHAQDQSEFPIVLNEEVLKQLNRYVGTPEGRDFMRKGLARMETYRNSVQDNLRAYGLPAEFMAVPIVESGYQNLVQDEYKMHGAGIWMFIKSTALDFGLNVDDTVDERLNSDLETDAAMRLLAADHLQFKSWELALLAYNSGAGNVRKGIRATGSHDVWTLIRSGTENDRDYYPRVMAAMLIMRNPKVLD